MWQVAAFTLISIFSYLVVYVAVPRLFECGRMGIGVLFTLTCIGTGFAVGCLYSWGLGSLEWKGHPDGEAEDPDEEVTKTQVLRWSVGTLVVFGCTFAFARQSATDLFACVGIVIGLGFSFLCVVIGVSVGFFGFGKLMERRYRDGG